MSIFNANENRLVFKTCQYPIKIMDMESKYLKIRERVLQSTFFVIRPQNIRHCL